MLIGLSACNTSPPLLKPNDMAVEFNKGRQTLSDNSLQAPAELQAEVAVRSADGSGSATDFHENLEIAALLENYIAKKNFAKEHIAITLRNYNTGDSYNLNEDEYFVAASTYKFYLATMYYDLIAAGKVSLDDSYRLDADEINSGGVIDSRYKQGDYIKVSELLHDMIIYSDNSAGHMLFNELGDYVAMKKLAQNYVTVKEDARYFSYDNIIKANFLADFASLVYADQDKYATLIKDLQQAEPSSYQNLLPEMHNVMAQKYGRYELACNSVGLHLDPQMSYVLVVLTDMSGYGERVIGEISYLIYTYYYKGLAAANKALESMAVLNYKQPTNVWYEENGNLGNSNNNNVNYPNADYAQVQPLEGNPGYNPGYNPSYGDNSTTETPDANVENPVEFKPLPESEPIFIPDNS